MSGSHWFCWRVEVSPAGAECFPEAQLHGKCGAVYVTKSDITPIYGDVGNDCLNKNLGIACERGICQS